MFSLEFMQTAFIASGIVAVICGLIGYFLLIRRETFAGHALSHVGFAGATGASLIGVSPFLGLLIFSLCAGGLIGAIGPKLKDRDIAIGLVLSASMGLGLLFLHFYTRYASQVTGLLFGNVFAVDTQTLYGLIILSIVCCIAMLFFMRPLLFASLQPDLAEAKGLSLRRVSIFFLGLVACVTAACVQVTGVLLTFSLMVGPAAVARQLSKTVWKGIFLSIFLALAETWGGIIIAWITDYPVSFWISLLSFVTYILSLLVSKNLSFYKKARKVN
ncbi:ABC-type Mn2+/Zn2+ transport system [Commensalibacter communis]|uniref:metal ABC transporter permease n=1 Tax=Commensalibacter communis TaxID=2972786 RepID=UPI0022FF9E0E|nr:metal ABC transporter permease [Commensalibacter communis]CAI3944744.1 ABC-type Mn2+/Zn2+ transport system [Commensalibacter communis]